MVLGISLLKSYISQLGLQKCAHHASFDGPLQGVAKWSPDSVDSTPVQRTPVQVKASRTPYIVGLSMGWAKGATPDQIGTVKWRKCSLIYA